MPYRSRMYFAALLSFAFFAIAWPKAGHTEKVVMAFTTSAPPYTFAKTDGTVTGREGIWVDVMREALALQGHTLEPRYIPYNRFAAEVESGRVHAVSLPQPIKVEMFKSGDAIHFKNYVFGHKDANETLKSLDELKGRSLVSWQGARDDLGPAFAKVTESLKFYKEIADQERQMLVFFNKRVDFTIVDVSIFKYLARKKGFKTDNYVAHDIIGGEIRFPASFVSEKIRNDFNAGMRKLKSTGRYDEIYRFYIDEFEAGQN